MELRGALGHGLCVNPSLLVPTKVRCPGGQRCIKDLCRQRIVHVRWTLRMHSGRGDALFKPAVTSSAARVCRRKRLDVANNGKNVTPWWNQKVTDAI